MQENSEIGPPGPALSDTPAAAASGPPLRVVHYLGGVSLAAGGVTRAVLDVLEVLADHGADVTLLTNDAADVPAEWSEPGRPRVIDLGPLNVRGGRLDAPQLRRVGEAIQHADAVHLHGVWEAANAQVAAVAFKLRVPYVLSTHGMLDDWSMNQSLAKRLKKEAYLRTVGRRFVGRAAAVHCTAEDERRQVAPRLRGRPVIVLPYAVDLDPFRDLPGPAEARAKLLPESSATWLLFLSRIHPKKQLDKLIDALALLRKDGRDVRLAVAGTGEEAYGKQLQERAKDAGVSEQIAWLGLVTGTAKVSLYEAADVFVLPTSQENFGLVLTESLACGTPVVTTRGTDIWREVEAAGGVVTTAEPADLAAAISTLLDDPNELAERGRRGRAWVFEHLDPDRLGAAYLDAYRGLKAGSIRA